MLWRFRSQRILAPAGRAGRAWFTCDEPSKIITKLGGERKRPREYDGSVPTAFNEPDAKALLSFSLLFLTFYFYSTLTSRFPLSGHTTTNGRAHSMRPEWIARTIRDYSVLQAKRYRNALECAISVRYIGRGNVPKTINCNYNDI